MKTYFLLFVLLLSSLPGCHTSAGNTSSANRQPGFLYAEHFRKPITDKVLYQATTEVIPLDTVYIASDTLHLITKKISGCNADDFKLMWSGNLISTSKPAKTTLKLYQEVDPSCKEKHQFHLIYNIKPLRQKPDSVINKTTLIGFGNYTRPVEYNY